MLHYSTIFFKKNPIISSPNSNYWIEENYYVDFVHFHYTFPSLLEENVWKKWGKKKKEIENLKASQFCVYNSHFLRT